MQMLGSGSCIPRRERDREIKGGFDIRRRGG